MRFATKLVAITTFLASITTAVTSPEYFVLKSKLIPGQTGKEAFDGLYGTSSLVPTANVGLIFGKANGAGAFFTFNKTDAPTNTNESSYGLTCVQSPRGPTYYTQVLYDAALFTLWQPVSLLESKANAPLDTLTGFYMNTTGNSGLELLWKNKSSKLSGVDGFVGWLLCDWWYGYPQLFFITTDTQISGLHLPSTCAKVSLEMIPIPNISN